MKRYNINTKKISKNEANQNDYYTHNNGFSFPTVSGSTEHDTNSSTTTYHCKNTSYKINKKYNFYSLTIDWLQFTCSSKTSIHEFFNHKKIPNDYMLEKVKNFTNPNYHKKYNVFYHNHKICEIYCHPTQTGNIPNKTSIKIENSILYKSNLLKICNNLLKVFELEFIRISRLDIALDGPDILNIIDLCNKYSKSPTIQTNNSYLKIIPTQFTKSKHKFEGWKIGNEKSGIMAVVYDKTKELLKSKKEYINDYWELNNLDYSQNVGRFEIRLYNKKLHKYNINNLSMLLDSSFISNIFHDEVKDWLVFYRVKKKDMLECKKETAIRRGHVIRYIKWNKLPRARKALLKNDYVSNSTITNAKRSITYELKEVLKNKQNKYNKDRIRLIKLNMTQYKLESYVDAKLDCYSLNDNTYMYYLRDKIFDRRCD